MTPEFASRSFMIIRSSMIIFGMVVGMSISTNAETVKVMDEASTDGSFTIAQTNGQEPPGHPAGLPSGGRGRRRGQAQLQTAGTPEVVAALPRVAYQRHQGVALCRPLGVQKSGAAAEHHRPTAPPMHFPQICSVEAYPPQTGLSRGRKRWLCIVDTCLPSPDRRHAAQSEFGATHATAHIGLSSAPGAISYSVKSVISA